MAGLLEIYNTALYRVKETPLVSVTDTTRPAVAVARSYDIQRPALLRRYRWQFAIRRQVLSPLATDPPFGFKRQFQLPADLLTVITAGADDQSGRWIMTGPSGEYRVENNRIMADWETVYLVYVKDETDPNKFDPLFVDALAWMVAADLALAIGADRELHLTAAQQADRAILAARRAGSIEQSAEAVVMGSRVLDARLGGASSWNPRWPEALP